MEYRNESAPLLKCHGLFNWHVVGKILRLGTQRLCLGIFVKVGIVRHTNGQLHESHHERLILFKVVRPEQRQCEDQNPSSMNSPRCKADQTLQQIQTHVVLNHNALRDDFPDRLLHGKLFRNVTIRDRHNDKPKEGLLKPQVGSFQIIINTNKREDREEVFTKDTEQLLRLPFRQGVCRDIFQDRRVMQLRVRRELIRTDKMEDAVVAVDHDIGTPWSGAEILRNFRRVMTGGVDERAVV